MVVEAGANRPLVSADLRLPAAYGQVRPYRVVA
jgi:hypothetical protein